MFAACASFLVTNDFKTDLGTDLAKYSYNGFLTLQLLVDSLALSIDADALDNHMRVVRGGGGWVM